MKSVLTITLTEDGQMQFGATGPVAGSKPMLVGLLEMAKAALLAPQPQGPAPSPLLVARGALPVNGRS